MSETAIKNRIYIDGAWVNSSAVEMIDVINPSTEEIIARVPAGTADDVAAAASAARRAFADWSQVSGDERSKYLQRISEGLGARSAETAEVIARELGMPLRLCQIIQAGLPTMTFGNFARIASEYEFEETIGNSIIIKEPAGVVGCITPWNYPLHQISLKVAPALAAGCTVVLKPSEVAPLDAYILAEVIDEIGLPAGVFNLVVGTGPVVGEAIVTNPEVDMVSFTGSTRAGKRVAELAAAGVKRVALELGGKSPNVILDDADLEKAVTDGVAKCYINSGQTCTALSRMLVPRDKLAEVESIAVAAAEKYTPGDPFEDSTRLGPLVSSAQRDRVRGYINRGIEEGARLVTGGPDAPDGLERGYFVQPTIFSDVSNDMTIAQEEIFGPVLSIIPYDDEEDAVRIANETTYGLGGAIWSSDPEHAKAIARRIRTGQIDINGAQYNPMAPFGGFKQSGLGREAGIFGLEEFLEIKSIQT